MHRFNRYGFIEQGYPYYGWLMAFLTSVIRTALNFDIPLIFYGEDGEAECGGSTETRDRALFDINYMKKVYLKGGYEKSSVCLKMLILQRSISGAFPMQRS